MKTFSNMTLFEEIVTHIYPIEKAAAALQKSMEPDCMKVVIAPE
jgi:threonine dehydrogenase-like Zn-dependent dehydrogenase